MSARPGKVALVTGGSSGIGRAAAHAFAKEGAKVVIAARGIDRGNEVVRRIRETGAHAIFVSADASKNKQMLAQNPSGGSIVNTSTVNGLGGVRLASAYAAAKSGMLALTKSAAQEYAKRGIRVNALVPGAFDTPVLQGGLERASGGNPKALKNQRTV